MLQGYALETATTTEVVAAYSCPPKTIDAAATDTPAEWNVVGEFYLPQDVESCRLDVQGLVSDASVTLQTRLFDMTDVVAILGSLVTMNNLVPDRFLSGTIALSGNRRYQIQTRAYGASGVNRFGHVTTACISD